MSQNVPAVTLRVQDFGRNLANLAGYHVFMKRRLLVGALSALSLAACGSPTVNLTASPSALQSSSAPSSSPSPIAFQTYPAAQCAGLTDSASSSATVANVAGPIYYQFGCDENRILVAMNMDGTGGVVFAMLQSEYSYGQITPANDKYRVTKTITSLNKVLNVNLIFYGPANDLRLKDMVRTVGPVAGSLDDITAFHDQDCRDYMSTGNHKDCKAMTQDSSIGFLKQGTEANWLNEFSS
ncbi:MAG: hypothetical protein F2839_01295 [Actinobacteria bacterium]|uniref:Unannotated protein n=1 Tax=freshwater metagenome TaxID=449393 RepID=A0A6J5YNQ6_9ZZZZ|nr:hypothetical protein [Actinomycetota bacterium]